VLQCYYYIDPTSIAPFPLTPTAWLPGLNVSFPTNPSAAGGAAADGTAPMNQTSLSLVNQRITDWTPGAALWLVWQMADSTGKSQGLGIDNLTFSASNVTPQPLPLSFQTSSTNVVLLWTGVAGQSYQIEYTTDLGSGIWVPLGNPVLGTGTALSFTSDFAQSTQRFFRLRLMP
jgi:hypothetical protein